MGSYVAEAGEFTRDSSYIDTRITADGRDGYPVQPDRYRLIVARPCPWANRAIIVRRLLGLEDVLSIGFCGPTHDERSWTFDRLFAALDWVGDRLARQRFLIGETITEADVRLFTTLARFDAVYHGHFKCNRSKLSEMPVLWAYARDLFQTPGFGDTTDFVQIKQHYYRVHTGINPTRIVPKGPELAGWLTPHGREALGGSPFGDGTPPGPTPRNERVPRSNGLL